MLTLRKITPPVDVLNSTNTNVPCTEEGCQSIFKSKSNLTMHIKRHHKKQILEPIDKNIKYEYYCPVEKCYYNLTGNCCFQSLKNLKQHYLKVHSAKNYACTKCDKKYSILVHKINHEKICGTNFYCLNCPNVYPTYEALSTHTKRKNHLCKKRDAYINKTIIENISNENPINKKTVFILPAISKKMFTEVSTQTEKITKTKRKNKTIYTQTSGDLILKRAMKDAEISNIGINKRSKNHSIETQTLQSTEEKATEPCTELLKQIYVTQNESTQYPLNVDVDLRDIFYNCGTQTSPPKVDSLLFNNESNILISNKKNIETFLFDNYISDRLNENKLCNIETQTDIDNIFSQDNSSISFFRNSAISNNIYTQTNSPTLLDLEFNDIETQTAWPVYRDELLVSTETQTSSFITELNHCQTQTDVGIHFNTEIS